MARRARRHVRSLPGSGTVRLAIKGGQLRPPTGVAGESRQGQLRPGVVWMGWARQAGMLWFCVARFVMARSGRHGLVLRVPLWRSKARRGRHGEVGHVQARHVMLGRVLAGLVRRCSLGQGSSRFGVAARGLAGMSWCDRVCRCVLWQARFGKQGCVRTR